MPVAVQLVTHLVAARYFIAILQSLFLAGDVWPVFLPNIFAMLAIGGVFLGITARKSGKTLDT